MTAAEPSHYTHLLQTMMQRVGVSSFKALSLKAGVSEWQVKQFRQGRIDQMRVEALRKLAQALEISLSELISTFSQAGTELKPLPEAEVELAALKLEYQRSQAQLNEQRALLWQEFQQDTLQVIESWLTFWPAATHAALQPDSKVKIETLIRLGKPIETLLEQWGIQQTAAVSTESVYDPSEHQLMEGTAQPGDRVRIRYPGYRQGNKLLYRAKVSPVV